MINESLLEPERENICKRAVAALVARDGSLTLTAEDLKRVAGKRGRITVSQEADGSMVFRFEGNGDDLVKELLP